MSATPARAPLLFAGSAHPGLAAAVARELDLPLAPATLERFPDRELHVELREDPLDRDVFLLQPTCPPGDEHLFELLALADAARRAGAGRITAVVPYLGYARQDRRVRGFEAVGARLVADLLAAGGVGRLVGLDLHAPAIESFFAGPLVHLSAVPVLAGAIRALRPANGVIVSPDLGAVRLAERHAAALELPVAIVHKTRSGPERVSATRITGDVRGRTPVVVDDMIGTGATVEAAVHAVREAGAARAGTIVAASHGLFTGGCVERLRGLDLARVLVTDSVPAPAAHGLPVETVSVAGLLAGAIRTLGGAAR
jgi:ribose-phosphate pyrophosphokinase